MVFPRHIASEWEAGNLRTAGNSLWALCAVEGVVCIFSVATGLSKGSRVWDRGSGGGGGGFRASKFEGVWGLEPLNPNPQP